MTLPATLGNLIPPVTRAKIEFISEMYIHIPVVAAAVVTVAIIVMGAVVSLVYADVATVVVLMRGVIPVLVVGIVVIVGILDVNRGQPGPGSCGPPSREPLGVSGRTLEKAAAKVYARRQRLGEEAIGLAHRLKVEALARLGKLLEAMPKATGAEGIGKSKSAVPERYRTQAPTYAALGLDRKTAMVAQQLAGLPEDELHGERAYGRKYAAALERTGYDYGTLRDAKGVATSVELSRRRDNLTWAHHREVAALGPAEQGRAA